MGADCSIQHKTNSTYQTAINNSYGFVNSDCDVTIFFENTGAWDVSKTGVAFVKMHIPIMVDYFLMTPNEKNL